MLTEKERQEYELLCTLSENAQPAGSLSLSMVLKEGGIEVSAATVGRMLSSFDHAGLTQRQGYQGRVLTAKGQVRMGELQRKRELDAFSSVFYNSVDAKGKDNLLDVLAARRGIEREIARLAALRATEEDVAQIREVLQAQSQKVASGRVTSENDVAFHRAVAVASKNNVLAAAYDFIWQNGRFSPIMEYMRTSVGGTVAVEHGKILDAIAAGDPEAAERAMVAHIDSLLEDVDHYWRKAQRAMREKVLNA